MISRNGDAAEITARKKHDAQCEYRRVFGKEPNARWGHIKIAKVIAKCLCDEDEFYKELAA